VSAVDIIQRGDDLLVSSETIAEGSGVEHRAVHLRASEGIMTRRIGRLERLIDLQSLLGAAWDAAYATADLDRGEQILARIRVVSAAITAEVSR